MDALRSDDAMRRLAMLLVIDSATAACSAALLGADGALIDERHELVGRGHAERLVPMIADLLAGRRPGRDPRRLRAGQLHRRARRPRRRARPRDRLGRAARRLFLAGPARRGERRSRGRRRAAGGTWRAFRAKLSAVTRSRRSTISRSLAARRGRGRAIARRARRSARAPRRWSRRAAMAEASTRCPAPPTPGCCRQRCARLPPRPIYGRAPDARPMT